MDRASDSGSEGWGFESLLAYQKRCIPFGDTPFLYYQKKGLENLNATVQWTVAIRRFRRMLLSVTSPFWRAATPKRKGGTRKGVKKTCQWHVFSPWESPFLFQTHPVGVWMEWKHLVSGVSLWGYTVFVFSIKGTRTIKCNSPVDCCLPPARRRQHLSVTSPFWRTLY